MLLKVEWAHESEKACEIDNILYNQNDLEILKNRQVSLALEEKTWS